MKSKFYKEKRIEEREKADEEIQELDKTAADVLQHLEMRPKRIERMLQ